MKLFCVYGHGKDTEVGYIPQTTRRIIYGSILSLSVRIGMTCYGGQRYTIAYIHIHRYTRGQYEHEDTLADSEEPPCPEESSCEITRSPLDLPLHKPSCIDNEYTDQTRNPKVP